MKKIIGLILGLVLVGGGGYWLWSSTNPSGSPQPAGQNVTLEGTIVCLPHKDTSGPQTLECATGLRDDQGRYHGLRDAPVDTPTNKRVRVTGVTESVAASDVYQSVDTIKVSQLIQL